MKVLGITLDRNMNFHTHIKNICRKAGQKLSALLRISPYLDQRKKVLLYKSMIKSQFNYCPLVWMFCSRQSNNLINKVHERGLRLTYRDETKDFQQILREQNEITIHQRNLQVLLTEVYKIINCIASPIMNLQKFSEIFLQKIGELSNMLRKQWRVEHRFSERIYTLNIKTVSPLMNSKSKIKTWKCDFCQRRLCKKYVKRFY